MKKIFILEDDPNRVVLFKKWFEQDYDLTIVDNVYEAKVEVNSEEFDVYFLDHDLGGEQMVSSDEYNTGCTLAKYINTFCIGKNKPFVVHSLNPVGAENIKYALKCQHGRVVYVMPFGTFDQSIFK